MPSVARNHISPPQTELATAPIQVVLFGVERLVPRGVDDDLARAWLSAPIGGLPLYRRLLEPIVGLELDEVQIVGGRIAELLVDLLHREPIFGVRGRRIQMPPLGGSPDAVTVMLPGSGILELDVRHLVGRVAQGAMNEEAHAFALAGDAQVHVLPPLRRRATPPLETKLHNRLGALRRVDTPKRLIALARRVLDRSSSSYHLHGTWRGDALCGVGSAISPVADIGLSAGAGNETAVGEESLVERCTRLGPGAIIGRKSYVCEGASILNAVVLDDTFISPWQAVRNVVRWRDRELA